VNESHAEKIVAEELCVIKRHPRDASRTVKTLTVRARLCIRGWWTLGLSTLAERFLLGRYELLVQQGKKIELDEIERWRVSGRADAARRRAETEKTALLLATSATLSESAFPESAQSALQTRKLSPSVLNARARTQDSPVSTLRRGVSAASVDTADGLGVESLEAFERSLLSSPSSATFPSPVGVESDLFDAREEDWLSMRYEGGFRTPQSAYAAGPALATTKAEENTKPNGKGGSLKTTAFAGTAAQSPPPRDDDDDDDAFFSPLHVPLEEVEEAEDASEDASEDAESEASASDAFERSRTRDSGTVEETERTVALRAREKSAATKNAVSRTPAQDDDDDDDGGGGDVNGDSDVGTPGAAARRFLSPPSAADERRVRRSASLKKKSLKKSLLLDEKVSALEKEKEDEIARRFGLETFEERAAARSLAWRRAVVRFASCCALAAVAHERREALEPLTSRLRSAAVAANRKLGMGRKKEAKRLRERMKAPTKTSRGAGAERRDEIAEVGAVGFDSAADLDGERTLVAFTPPSAEA